MAKGLVSLLKESLSNLNDLRYFGDVVVYSSNDFLGTSIEWYTKNEFTHCALRTGKNKAEGVRINWLNLIPFIEKGDIKRYHNLENPLKEYERYLILRHKDISLFKRIKMKKIYKEMEIREYDLFLFLRKAFNYKILGKSPDLRDLSREESYLCGSQTDYPLFRVSLKSKPHWSQIEPQHFLKDENFEIIEEGFRAENGEWIRKGRKNKSEPSGSISEKIKGILPSYRVPLQLEQKK